MMNELDSVILITKFENLAAGTKGTIVQKYDEHNFEVEFVNDDGDTVGVYKVTDSIINHDTFQ